MTDVALDQAGTKKNGIFTTAALQKGVAFVVLWPSIPRLSTSWARAHIPFRLNEGLDIRGGGAGVRGGSGRRPGQLRHD